MAALFSCRKLILRKSDTAGDFPGQSSALFPSKTSGADTAFQHAGDSRIDLIRSAWFCQFEQRRPPESAQRGPTRKWHRCLSDTVMPDQKFSNAYTTPSLPANHERRLGAGFLITGCCAFLRFVSFYFASSSRGQNEVKDWTVIRRFWPFPTTARTPSAMSC